VQGVSVAANVGGVQETRPWVLSCMPLLQVGSCFNVEQILTGLTVRHVAEPMQLVRWLLMYCSPYSWSGLSISIMHLHKPSIWSCPLCAVASRNQSPWPVWISPSLTPCANHISFKFRQLAAISFFVASLISGMTCDSFVQSIFPDLPFCCGLDRFQL
jgi:hypothetical protein